MRKKWSLKTTVTQNAMLELEQNLVKWVHIMRENKISLSGPMVQEKAMEFAKAIKVTNFVPSNGWPDRFEKREALD